MHVEGGFYSPGELQQAAAQVLQLTFFGGLAISLVGRGLLPEPQAKFIEQNQMPILGACFVCNIVSGNLMNTGAFEVEYNGKPIWSKIESGRFPQMEELRDNLVNVMAAPKKMAAAADAPTAAAGDDDAPPRLEDERDL